MRFISPDKLKPDKGIPWHRSTLFRMENGNPPRFPSRTKLGPNTVAYAEPVIDEYVKALAAGHDDVTATKIAEKARPPMTPEKGLTGNNFEHSEGCHPYSMRKSG